MNEVHNKQGDKVIMVDPAVFREDLGSFMPFNATHVTSKCSSCASYLLVLMNRFCICAVPEYNKHISMLSRMQSCVFLWTTTGIAQQLNIAPMAFS